MYSNGSNKKAAACFIANSLNIFKPGPRSGIQKIKKKRFLSLFIFDFLPRPAEWDPNMYQSLRSYVGELLASLSGLISYFVMVE